MIGAAIGSAAAAGLCAYVARLRINHVIYQISLRQGTTDKPRSEARMSLAIAHAWLACALMLVSATEAQAQVLFENEDQKFDPARCSVDTGGKVLVRLTSGLAFWFEPYTFVLRDGLAKPLPPSGEPEGCPGNPIVTRAVSFPIQYTEALEAKRRGLSMRNPPVQAFSIFGHDGPTRLQDSEIERHAFLKGQGNACRVTEEGVEICLVGCRPDPDQSDQCRPIGQDAPHVPLKEDLASSGLALPGVYAEFKGRRFAYGCMPPLKVSAEFRPRSCDVRYEIAEGLSVTYRFDSSQIPEDNVLTLDKMIRDQILAARAPEHDLKQ